MQKRKVDLVVIGGGPAGLAAALAADEEKVQNIVLIERDIELGGILHQCIHNGFGLHYFGEELTGPEYAQRFIDWVAETKIEIKTNTMVLEIAAKGQEKWVYAVNRTDGMVIYQTKAVVLAMGCRERTREAIRIPGSRPAGIFTAGTVQRYINIEGYLPGKKVLILGSGDIGLIMARRMTLEGSQVLGVLEIMPYSNGLTRNIVQCLEDYQIPLLLSHTVVQIHGFERIEGVTIARVDANLVPIPGTERYQAVDTLLLSVGLIPENELTRMAEIGLDKVTGGALVNQNRETSIPGIFACGNVLQVHDLVDYVTEEANLAGRAAARYIDSQRVQGEQIEISPGNNVRYVIPQKIQEPITDPIDFYLRVTEPMSVGEIQFWVGKEEIYRTKKKFLKPAEMIRITVSFTNWEKMIQVGKLSVVIKEVS